MPKSADQIAEVRWRSGQLQTGHSDDVAAREIQLRDHSRETDACAILRDATPRRANNCASIADTTSSNGPRPATQATGPAAVPGTGSCFEVPVWLTSTCSSRSPMMVSMERVISAGALAADGAPCLVVGGELQRRQHNTVVIVDQGPIREHLLRLIERLIRVVGERALVESVHFRQCRSVAEQYVKELERFDMSPHARRGTASEAWRGSVPPGPISTSRRRQPQ